MIFLVDISFFEKIFERVLFPDPEYSFLSPTGPTLLTLGQLGNCIFL